MIHYFILTRIVSYPLSVNNIILPLTTMFLCCDGQKENNKQAALNSIDHRNPISRRINSKKTSNNQSTHPLKQSLPHAPLTNTRTVTLNPPLTKSILMPDPQDQLLKGTKITQKTSHSVQRQWAQYHSRPQIGPQTIRNNPSILQKYVVALEKSNRYLQMELSRHQSASRGRFTSELVVLRDRLKKVDLTRMCEGLVLSRQKTEKTSKTSAPSVRQ